MRTTSPHRQRSFRRGVNALLRAAAAACVLSAAAVCVSAQVRIHLNDGRTIETEEAWEDAQGVWFKRNNITEFIERARVRRVERDADGKTTDSPKAAPAALATTGAKENEVVVPSPAQPPAAAQTVWIHLVGGAKMEVDEANENSEGVWFKRANLSIFIEKSRVERVEYETVAAAAGAPAHTRRKTYSWTTGSAPLDALIKQNGARYGVDPYLIFCVMEHESQFRHRAVSPAGARGLMQLMPGTAARFGVRDVFDPAQNVAGGTRYLKELLRMWDGRVDLALASYNAGEGAVLKYGKTVPPYRETRNYVKRIGARYGAASATPAAKANEDTAP